ncbi:Neprilysin, partial [Aphelenchoides avenae]
ASFDKSGNYRNWWDPATYQTFLTRKQCLIDQYSRFQIPEASGRNVDGELTQGENIADNGGLKEAYQAYREHVRKLGREEAPLPGLEKYTQDQIFFLAFARTYCTNISPQKAEELRTSDVHSPGRFRVLGTLMNSQDFARAFQCPAASPMNPSQKCAVW